MNHNDPSPLDIAEQIVDEALKDAQRAASLRRRLRVTLHDLGALDIVGATWASIGAGSVEFEALPLAQADRLVRLLEGLVDGQEPATEPPATLGQLSLPLDQPSTPRVAVLR